MLSLNSSVWKNSQGAPLRLRVLVFQRNRSELVRWAEALSPSFQVRAVSDLEDMDELLRSEPVDVVVCEWQEQLLERIQATQPGARVIHCGDTLPEGVIDAAGKGLGVSHVDRLEELPARVMQLIRPRSMMLRQKLNGFSVRWAELPAAYPLLELSNDGLAFGIESGQELEPLLPGAFLEGLQVFSRQEEVVLTGITATVRHLEVSDTSPGWYWVGCEIRPQRTPRTAERVVLIRDRAWCAALLRSALDGGGILLQPLDEGSLGIHCTAGQVTASSSEFAVSSGTHSFSEYDVVRGRFEIGGGVYRFHTSVIARSPLRLRLPVVIEETQKRSSPRYQLSPEQPIAVRLTSSLLQTPALHQVWDLSGSGFSFEFDAGVDVFPPGMCFTKIELRVGKEEIQCKGQVKNLARIPEAPGKLRCGVEFDGLDEGARVRLADLIMRSRFPSLQDGRSVSFNELWNFFRQTKFMYPEKQQRLTPIIPELRQTLERLNSRPTKMFKSVVFIKGGQVVGYVSGLRAYRNTWLSQHLAASQGGQGGRLLNFGLAEYFGQNVDLEYFKIFYRPENRWPARVFGGFARNISDLNLSDLRTYGYFTIESDPDLVPRDRSIEVFEPSDSDLRIVERRFVEMEHGLILKANDLTCSALRMAEIDECYQGLRLHRRRHVLLAMRRHTPVGFALAEVSSPGLNLSELLSAFSIHLLPGAMEYPAAVRSSLLHAVLSLYRKAGRPFAIGLVTPDEVSHYQQFRLQTVKQYRCWTCHRSLYLRFCDYIDRLVQSLMERQRRHTSIRAANRNGGPVPDAGGPSFRRSTRVAGVASSTRLA